MRFASARADCARWAPPASDYIYLVKPLIMACVPRGMMRSVKQLQWKLQSRDTKK